MGPSVLDSAVEIFTGHPRHVQVGQDHVVAAMGQQFKRFATTFYGVDVVSVPPQREVKYLSRIGFILNDQDAVGHCLHPVIK
jgi:hypothetical protein